MSIFYIGVGSNLGDRQGYLDAAAKDLLSHSAITAIKKAAYIETPPWGNTDQGPFLNSVFAVETTLSPEALLAVLQDVERKHGRVRTIHWGPRTLDLDIIVGLDDNGQWIQCETDTLQVPHPYFWDRAFVLEPLAALLPHFSYEGKTIQDRLRELALADA